MTWTDYSTNSLADRAACRCRELAPAINRWARESGLTMDIGYDDADGVIWLEAQFKGMGVLPYRGRLFDKDEVRTGQLSHIGSRISAFVKAAKEHEAVVRKLIDDKPRIGAAGQPRADWPLGRVRW